MRPTLIRAGRSFLAIVAGLAAAVAIVLSATALGVLLFFGGDFTAEPTSAWLAVNLSYTALAGVVGGWLGARLAPRHSMAHAMAVAAAMLIMGSGGGGTDATPGIPPWYGATVTLLGAGGALVGGFVHRRRTKPAEGAPTGEMETP